MLPILILAYNRLSSLSCLIDSIEDQPHGPIYLHCDGMRNTQDIKAKEIVVFAQELLKNGRVEFLKVQPRNLGLMKSIQSAADWFFGQVDFGIVVEDDLILNSPVLDEAEKLYLDLIEFREFDTFCLANPLPEKLFRKSKDSYWISDFFVSYGWGTSRKNWINSKRSLEDLDFNLIHTYMKSNFGYFVARNFDKFISKEREREWNESRNASFAWRFTLSQILDKKRFAILTPNRIGYTGFGSEATNTTESKGYGSNLGIGLDVNHRAWQIPKSFTKSTNLDRYFIRDFRFLRAIRILLKIRTRIQKIMAKNFKLFFGKHDQESI